VKWLALLLFSTNLAAETVTVAVHETTVVKFAHATAAYAVDASIADAVARSGEVSISGKSTGETQVVVVTGSNQLMLDVKVTAPSFVPPKSKRGATEGRMELRYGTAERRTQGVVDVGGLHVETVHYGSSKTTLPSISYRAGRFTFFDRLTDESPLTISNTTIRGLHYIDDRWHIHAGTTAFTAYQSFLIPTQRQNLLDAAFRVGGGFTAGALVTSKGSVASMLYDYRKGDELFARGEVGVGVGRALSSSRGRQAESLSYTNIGGAAQFGLDRDSDRVRVDLRYRPQNFVNISPGETRGFYADSSWSRTFGRGAFDAALSSQQHTTAATANLRYRLTDSLSLLGGASYGSFTGTHSYSASSGVQLDRNRFGASALARWTNNAPGFRVAARTSLGRIYASAYVDYQQQAPTLDIVYRDDPALALALQQLGITATSVSDIARALRENAALIELGYIEGVTVDLTPTRTQAGFEIAWTGSRMQLRARVLANRNETVSRHTDTLIASLTASRGDLFATITYWKTPQLEIGFRRTFDELPSFARGTIRGRVESPVPVEVELDGAKRVTTTGTFAFEHVTSGPHRVTARISDARDAYFTTPSRVEAIAGDTVTFGVSSSPAHLFGHIVSDAGDGIGGIAIALTRGATRLEATSDSSGTFAINAAPGDWDLSLDTLSLPPGFSLADASRSIMLAAAQPSNVSFTVRANRSVSGHAPSGVSIISVEPLGMHVPVAADGAFTIRSLPAGAITLRAGSHTTKVLVPREPAALHAAF